jgi:hypothetical protein
MGNTIADGTEEGGTVFDKDEVALLVHRSDKI